MHCGIIFFYLSKNIYLIFIDCLIQNSGENWALSVQGKFFIINKKLLSFAVCWSREVLPAKWMRSLSLFTHSVYLFLFSKCAECLKAFRITSRKVLFSFCCLLYFSCFYSEWHFNFSIKSNYIIWFRYWWLNVLFVPWLFECIFYWL